MRLPLAAYVLIALFAAAVVSAVLSPSAVTIAIVLALVVYTLATARMMRPRQDDEPAVVTRSRPDSAWRRERPRRGGH